MNPYSLHSGQLKSGRPVTTKSAPDANNYLRCDNPEWSNFQRVQSADSILDYHTKRVIKGKSLDLTFELDNDGYERSCPDVSYDTADVFSYDSNEPSDYVTRTVGDMSETSLRQEDDNGASHNVWGIVVIGGKGKHSADMYKTTVDIWKCDIGPG